MTLAYNRLNYSAYFKPLLLFCVLAAMLVTCSQSAQRVYAQDEAAPAPAEQDVAGSGDDADADSQISYLQWAGNSLGLFYGLVFLGISFLLVALFVMNLLTARRDNVIPSELIEGFEKHLDAKQFQEAYELANLLEATNLSWAMCCLRGSQKSPPVTAKPSRGCKRSVKKKTCD